jgi:hypothetical protein
MLTYLFMIYKNAKKKPVWKGNWFCWPPGWNMIYFQLIFVLCLIPCKIGDFPLRYYTQTGSAPPPLSKASSQMGTEGSFPGAKAPRTWNVRSRKSNIWDLDYV